MGIGDDRRAQNDWVTSPLTNIPIERARHELLDAIQKRFGWSLHCFGWDERPSHRDDVTFHGWFHRDHFDDVAITNDVRRAVRKFVIDNGWQMSRNPEYNPVHPSEELEYVYLALIQPVELAVAYHAT